MRVAFILSAVLLDSASFPLRLFIVAAQGCVAFYAPFI